MIGKTLGTLLAVSLFAAPSFAQGRIPADAISINGMAVYNSPADVASWPVTTAITRLEMRPRGVHPDGLSFTFAAQQTWPDYWPPGWDGPLQYTVWAIWRANGTWYTSGIIQMWRGRESTGAPILTDFALNWIYDGRWGPGYGHQPVAGELMGFFVTAGDARGNKNVTSVRERSNVVAVNLPAGDTGVFTWPATMASGTRMDVDGDGKSEAVVYRPSTGQWLGLGSSSNFTQWAVLSWGQSGDIPVPGDYDGDGLTDVAVYRPSTGAWLISKSSSRYSTWMSYQWGAGGDIPVPGDYDGDGVVNAAVYRPSTGQWLILKANYQWQVIQWGAGGDIPVPSDYDGDGKTDVAVYRPSTGYWLITKSSQNLSWVAYQWGTSSDVPVAADYDGDGKSDVAIYRPSTGQWLVIKSSTNYQWAVYSWGISGDVPVPGDYDGDRIVDLAVYRPSSGAWLISKSSTRFSTWIVIPNWGMPGDQPVVQTP